MNKAKSCLECRRAKQRCNARDKFPNKCSRCTRLNKRCDLAHSSISHDIVNDNYQLPSYEEYQQIPFDPVPDIVLDGIPVAEQSQRELYESYITNLHPVFPIVPPYLLSSNSPLFLEGSIAVHKKRILFWAMLACAASVDRANTPTQQVILTHVQLLISQGHERDYLAYPHATLSYILSLELLGFWHTGARRMQDDSAWMYSGMAHQLAVITGLHSPHTEEYGASVGPQAKQVAWVGLYISNTLMAMGYGLPLLINEVTLMSSNLSPELDLQAKLLREYQLSCQSLSRDTQQMCRRSFVSRISSLVSEQRNMTPITQLYAEYSKLMFFSEFLLPGYDYNQVVNDLYECASRTAAILDSLAQTTNTKTLPLFIVRLITTAIIILYRLMAVGTLFVDEVETKQLISRLYGHVEHHPAQWSAIFVQSLQQFYNSGQMSNVVCKIKTRKGASVVIYTAMEVLEWRKHHDPQFASDYATEQRRRMVSGHERITLNDI